MVAESLQNYYDCSAREVEICKLQEEIIKEACEFNEEERERLRLEYYNLEHEKESLVGDINFWSKRQLGAIELIKSQWVAKELEKFRITHYDTCSALRNFRDVARSILNEIEDHLFIWVEFHPIPPHFFPDGNKNEFDSLIEEAKNRRKDKNVDIPKKKPRKKRKLKQYLREQAKEADNSKKQTDKNNS